MRAAIYARYSSDRQNPLSIDDQVAMLTRLADHRGWAVVAHFMDAAISGAYLVNRPGINAALAAAERGEYDVLLVEDEDRIARNLEQQAHVFNRLRNAGADVATPGKAQISIMDVALKGLMGELALTVISEKTKRGMAANAEKGLATGSRLLGYRSSPGGGQVIVADEAAVVAEVCRLYADEGLSGREIAARLNSQGVKGPRGGYWNASSILGSRQRGNGILNTEQYAGVKVWNRMLVKKDPATGKRRPTMKPASEWKRTPVPELAIVPADLWARVQARRAAEGGQRPTDLAKKNRPGLFSGLLKCARCGSSYTGHHTGSLMCAGRKERGRAFCDNGRSVRRDHVELRVLDGLRSRLLSPAAVLAYVRAYRDAYAQEVAARAADKAPLERRAAELARSIERLVDAICDGSASPAMRQRLDTQEAERADILARLANLPQDDQTLVALHPKAGDVYAKQIERLQETLAAISEDPTDATHDRNLIAAVRGLVDQITIEPLGDAPRGPVKITLHGDLSRFLSPASGSQTDPSLWVTDGSWSPLHTDTHKPVLKIAC